MYSPQWLLLAALIETEKENISAEAQGSFCMKKLLAVVAAGVVLVSALSAQITVGGKGTLALNVGTSVEKAMFGGMDVDTGLLVGGGGSLFVRYNLPSLPALGFQADVGIMANNGFSAEGSETGYSFSTKGTYTSLELPVLVTYDLAAGPVTITLLAGPNLSFPLGKAKVEQSFSSDYGSYDATDKWDIDSKVLFGLTAGAAVAYPLGPGAIVGDLRYTTDFNKVKVEGQEAMTRRALTFSAGYQIKL